MITTFGWYDAVAVSCAVCHRKANPADSVMSRAPVPGENGLRARAMPPMNQLVPEVAGTTWSGNETWSLRPLLLAARMVT